MTHPHRNRFLYLLGLLGLLGFVACDDEPADVAYPGGNPYGYQGQPYGTQPAPQQQNVPPQYGAPYGQGVTPGGPGPGPMLTDRSQVAPTGPAPGATTSTTSTTTTVTTPPPSGPAGTPSYPKGIPVPDKPGFVMSPYTKPGEGYVDVRGYPTGMEVTDPYSGGIFLVP